MPEENGFEKDLSQLNEDVQADLAGMLKVLGNGQSRTTIASTGHAVPTMANARQHSADASPKNSGKGRNGRHQRQSTLNSDERSATLVNITTRLTHQTNEMLTEVSLRQRLKKRPPSSRQEIVEEALLCWFRQEGYLKDG